MRTILAGFMMRALCAVVLLGPAVAAFGQGSFDSRAKEARSLEQTKDGQAFQPAIRTTIGPRISALMRECHDTVESPDLSPFTLVGDIGKDHSLSNVEVRPETNVALCMAKGLSNTPFPSLPSSFDGSAYPFVLDMHFH